MRKLVVLLLVAALVVPFVEGAKKTPPIKATSAPKVSFEPSDVTIFVDIQPHKDNDYLAFYLGRHEIGDVQSSLEKIEPDWQSHVLLIRGLSKGEYYVRVYLYRKGTEKPYAMSKTVFKVLGGLYDVSD